MILSMSPVVQNGPALTSRIVMEGTFQNGELVKICVFRLSMDSTGKLDRGSGSYYRQGPVSQLVQLAWDHFDDRTVLLLREYPPADELATQKFNGLLFGLT